MTEARYLLGLIRMATGDDQAASVEIRRGSISSPGTAKSWHQLGRLFGRLGDQAGATRQWWRSYSGAPDNDKILDDLLTLLQNDGKTPRGRDCWIGGGESILWEIREHLRAGIQIVQVPCQP